ncbi:uncharacterized protein LTR77_010661 [Saxophila tyrrhenica]|uniref:2,6-dihydroxypyridine 3-monooxygenase substrate binding domain-containing protein n=1 Tax=Saxophila tyrrhenica TaxID=1690608 RepID=A0AAV9NV87_9PEZI|nr:hypothetical protein LTR77_010661 [Saxophila tyrrhenica]
MNGYVCRNCRLQAAVKRRLYAGLYRGQQLSQSARRKQDSVDDLFEEASRPRGRAGLKDDPERPLGRYSARALRPQQLLEQLDKPAQRDHVSSQQQVDSRPPQHENTGPRYRANKRPPRDTATPRQPSLMHEGDVTSRLWKLRETLIHASDAGEENSLDQEVWPLLVEILSSGGNLDLQSFNSANRDGDFRAAIHSWTIRICDAWLLRLPSWLSSGARADTEMQSQPTALQAIELCALFSVGFRSKAAKVLWYASRDLWELRSTTSEDSSSEKSVLRDVVEVWNLCMANQLWRGDLMRRSKFPYFRSLIADRSALTWDFLPKPEDIDVLVQQPTAIGSTSSSIARSMSVLCGQINKPLDSKRLPAFSGQYHHDSASAAILTMSCFTKHRRELPDPSLKDFEPWMELMGATIQKVPDRRVPDALAERATTVTDQAIADKYKALFEELELDLDAASIPPSRSVGAVQAPRSGNRIDAHSSTTDQLSESPKNAQDPVESHIGSEKRAAMDDAGAMPSEEQSPSSTEANLKKRFTWLSIKRLGRAAEQQDLKATDRVRGDVYKFVKDNPGVQLPLQLYEHLILTYLALRNFKGATECWGNMLRAGHQATAKTYTIAIRYSQRLKSLDAMNHFWAKMRQERVQPDVHAWTACIYGLFTHGRVDAGLRALTDMGQEWLATAKAAQAPHSLGKAKKGKPSSSSASSDQVVHMVQGDINGVPKPTVYTMNSAITGLSINHSELIPKILGWGRSFGIEPDSVTYNTLINVSMRNGQPAEAMNLLRRMRSLNMEADGNTWNILFNALFESGVVENLEPKQQEEKVMQLITSLEEANAAPIAEKGYGVVIDRMARIYNNPKAFQTVLNHMMKRGVEPTSYHYTTLMQFYFEHDPPDLAAVESLWNRIKTGKTGYGTALGPPFYNRMVEGYAMNHAAVGTAPMLSFLSQMEAQGKRPSWRALECVARALAKREEWDRLVQIADTVRRRLQESGVGGTTTGQHDFWAFVISTGIYRHEGITEPNQLMVGNMGRPIGGSLAGLMHALTFLSLPNPPKVRILERSPTALLHNQGAGVVAGGDTLHFFEQYVRPGREISVCSPMRHYLDRKGEEMPESVEHRTQRMTSWDLLYHLLRWRVEGLESEYVEGLERDERPKADYENGCIVTNVEDAGSEGVKLTWTHKDRGEGQTATADLVVAADGASSSIRRMLMPEVERKYAGYVAWRGTVPETELSDAAKDAFVEKFTFFHQTGTQILGYLIPGRSGTLEAGQRLFNWVWYCNYNDGSAELEELMTGTDGKRHAITLPVGTMKPQVWEQQKDHAKELLPPQFAEAVGKTQQPFVQAITDNIAPQNSFLAGKVLMVGDALAGFRPHTAASTSQAAFDALTLGLWMGGEIDQQEYGARVKQYARETQKHGVNLGERSQFGRHPLAG